MPLRRRRDDEVSSPADSADGEAAEVDAVLGTLRSELDDDAELPELFADVYTQVDDLRTAVQQGSCARETAARTLAHLRIAAPDGTLWSVGAESLVWYRKLPGGSWSRMVPPLGDDHTTYELAAPPSSLPSETPPADEPAADADAERAAEQELFDRLAANDGTDEGLDVSLRTLPDLDDDPARKPEGRQEPLELPRLIPPGQTVASTDDALGDDGQLDDDDLAALSGQADDDDDGLEAGLAALEALRGPDGGLGGYGDELDLADFDEDDEDDEDASGYGDRAEGDRDDWVGPDAIDDEDDGDGYGFGDGFGGGPAPRR
jgi:hypothetical protein